MKRMQNLCVEIIKKTEINDTEISLEDELQHLNQMFNQYRMLQQIGA